LRGYTTMNFIKRFSTIGNRALARTIAKEMAELYICIKRENSENTKKEILKKVLYQSNIKAAQELLNAESFWANSEPLNLGTIIYIVVTDSSPINKKKLFIPKNNAEAYVEEIRKILNEYGLANE